MEEANNCNLCSQTFISRSNLNRHIRSQHEGIRPAEKKRFKCNMCGYKSHYQENLIVHMRTHTGERPYKCTVTDCGMAFTVESSLKNHIKYKHSDERPLKCKFPGCSYTTKTIQGLTKHRKVHTDAQLFACPHSGCNYRSKQKSNIKRHVTSVHAEAKTFTCSKCDYKSAQAALLKLHMRRHSARRQFQCSHLHCTEAFKSLHSLKLHFGNRHGERNCQCDHAGCGRKYGSARALMYHKSYVHSKKIRACPDPECNYSTTTASRLASHIQVHELRNQNEKISCSIEGCECKGRNTKALKKHMRRHKTFLPCPVSGCGRYVSSNEALQNHVKLHNPSGRPHKCTFCFKHFPTLNEVRMHCVAHTNEKPYVCGHCEYEASLRSTIRSHISVAHGDVEFPLIVHLLDDRECLRCKVTLPWAEFLIHYMSHAVPVVMIERLKASWS